MILSKASRTPSLLALIATLPSAASAAAAAAPPRLASVVVVAPASNAAATVATTGPVSVLPFAPAQGPLAVAVLFDRPIAAVRRVEIGSTMTTAQLDAGNARQVNIALPPHGDGSEIRIRLIDVVDANGEIQPSTQIRFGALAGDYTGDGLLSQLDIAGFVSAYFTGSRLADLDGNGIVSQLDVSAFVSTYFNASRLTDLPPDLSVPPSAFAPSGGSSAPIALRVRDDRRPENAIALRIESSDATVVDPAAADISGDAGERSLTVRGADGITGTATVTVIASDGRAETRRDIAVRVGVDQPPTALIDARQHVGVAPLTVTLDARPSNDAEGPIASYDWQLGDGATATGDRATHTFSTPGEHTVRLTVRDNAGNSDTETRIISVAPAAWTPPGQVTRAEAIRFLWQAAWGPTEADIAQVMSLGFEGWIDQQISTPPSYITEAFAADRGRRLFAEEFEGRNPTVEELASVTSNWYLIDDIYYGAPDQLRQRTAWALAQVIPVNAFSVDDAPVLERTLFHEYLRHAFADPSAGTDGNYRSLLSAMSYNGVMGNWLTFKGNQKANPALNLNPDENYAREIIQLFSVGLLLLDPDGTPQLNVFGETIDSYDNADIRQFARVFTGLVDADGGPDDPTFPSPYPMIVVPSRHEFGAKQLLTYPGAVPAGGLIPALPDGTGTEVEVRRDIAIAIENLFQHPSHPPFLATLMIKRFTTSNPTPAYVRRVADAYAGSGPYGTVRGSLASMMKAILLDDEARNPAYRSNPLYGKVLEPMLVQMGVARTFGLADPSLPFYPEPDLNFDIDYRGRTGQGFMLPPSVFNFYLPTFAPLNTQLSAAGFAAPELQIFDDFKAVASTNDFTTGLLYGLQTYRPGALQPIVAGGYQPSVITETLADPLDHGWLTPATRARINSALGAITDEGARLQAAPNFIVGNPEFRVLR
ncbi:MAG: DUF1800 family protein [Planctomycetota bacterium]